MCSVRQVWPSSAQRHRQAWSKMGKKTTKKVVRKGFKKKNTTTSTCIYLYFFSLTLILQDHDKVSASSQILQFIIFPPPPQPSPQQKAYLEFSFLFEELSIQSAAHHSESVLKEVCIVSWQGVCFTVNITPLTESVTNKQTVDQVKQ